MKIPVKYIILLFAFGAGTAAYSNANIGAGIAAAGAFIAYGAIEIYDLMLDNRES